ncbi:hypothetical protein F5B20DRAFT_561464 [Whalleya microplaca]|nr:hypothetical protein F5B20DRAFT_561464 [Whalleya microplaca]
MSVADAFVSSPPGPSRCFTISSSPKLPSLDEIFTKSPKKPPLKSGSHAVPIPSNVRTTFTSAANILRDAPEIDIETEQVTNSPPRKATAKTNRGRKKKATTPDISNDPTENPILVESSPSDKPWQKFKSKKQEPQDEQVPIPKQRVTAAPAKNKTRAKTETVSRHFATKEASAQPEEEKGDKGKAVSNPETQTIDDTSGLETAMRRRHDWTPPPNNEPVFLGSDSDNRELLSSVDKVASSKDVFQSLLDDYGCKDAPLPPPSGQQQQSEILKKRKRIELVFAGNEDTRQPSRETSPSKPAATKKKTRTITELATAPYVLPIEPELDLSGPSTKDSLLNYFDSDGAVKALVEHQTAVMSQKLEKGKGKEPKAVTKPKRKKKSGTADKPILLSPDSALKQYSNQDFVFGTSSQLVREDSPATIRELQMAIQASNRPDSDPFASPDGQGLWHAGARDVDGDLMKVDVIDAIEDSPVLPRFREQGNQSRQEFVDINDILKSSDMEQPSTKGPQPAPKDNSDSLQSQSVLSAPISKASGSEPAQPTSAAAISNPRPTYELFTDAQLAKQISSYGFKPVKKRQAMIALLDQCWASKNPGASMSLTQSHSISTTSAPKSPKRKPSTTSSAPAQPAKPRGRPRKNPTPEKPSASSAPAPKPAAAAATASPKKPRGRQKKTKAIEIADSDSASASSAPAPKPAAAAAATASPKKPRGRQKKTKAIEIADSDSASASTSRASSPGATFSSPPPPDLSVSDDTDLSLTLPSPTDPQARLFTHITKAVTSAPRSRDPARPSWHEKMLMYDPIVLEDLADWLNGGALAATGYDGEEVEPADVKRWCESRSVVCLWRRNMRGKERVRY